MADAPELWEQQCPTCPLVRSCGGMQGAPCGCIWVGTALAYQCHICTRVCREQTSLSGQGDSAGQHLRTTRSLSEINLSQVHWADWTPPAFVPTGTHELGADTVSPVIAVTLDRLLSISRQDTSDGLVAAERRRRLGIELRAPDKATLIAVLHGDDPTLRSFWNRDRRQLLAHLRLLGFAAATGPTFSVVMNPRERLPFENHLSLRQHHQVVQEIADAGLVPIPNLYSAGSANEAELGAWLRAESSVRLVSRDFSRTKGIGADFHLQLSQLSRILNLAGRPMHVLLQGISIGKARLTANALRMVGASCSVVSGQPILRAIVAGERLVSDIAGSGRFVKARSRERLRLAAANLREADRIFTLACGEPATLQQSAPRRDRRGGSIYFRVGTERAS
jgi:hypothetical protein